MQPQIHEIECPDPGSIASFQEVLKNPSSKLMKKTNDVLESIKAHLPEVLHEHTAHKMSYMEWGQGDDVVVCVHGLTRNSRDFDFLAQALADAGFRVICPDIVGRGRSEWLKNPALYGYPLYVQDILFLLKTLKLGQVKWVGTSMGGLIGMMIAAGHPKIISKMVLNDIGPHITKESLERIGSYAGQKHDFASRAEAEKYLREIMDTFGINDDGHWNHMVEHSFVHNPDGSCSFAYDPNIANAFWNSRGKMRVMQDVEMWPMWELIKCKILVMRGAESDLLTRETAEKMKESENVEDVVEIAGAGHAPSLMADDQIEIIKNWLLKD